MSSRFHGPPSGRPKGQAGVSQCRGGPGQDHGELLATHGEGHQGVPDLLPLWLAGILQPGLTFPHQAEFTPGHAGLWGLGSPHYPPTHQLVEQPREGRPGEVPICPPGIFQKLEKAVGDTLITAASCVHDFWGAQVTEDLGPWSGVVTLSSAFCPLPFPRLNSIPKGPAFT